MAEVWVTYANPLSGGEDYIFGYNEETKRYLVYKDGKLLRDERLLGGTVSDIQRRLASGYYRPAEDPREVEFRFVVTKGVEGP